MISSPPKFTCVPLGVDGGLNEGNLSAYLLAPHGSDAFACLDAGTVWKGLEAAIRRGAFADVATDETDLSAEGYVLRNHVRAYLITHTYLDHVAGLAIVSPEDNQKPILAMQGVIDDLRDHLFNWKTWPNFADQGAEPCLGQYRYIALPERRPETIPGTEMKVTAFPLTHRAYDGNSTAFLIEAGGSFALYMGDTGPDEVESSDKTLSLWKAVAPLIRDRLLRGIFVEASYRNARPDDLLYSHLTPAWLFKALRQLAELTDPHAPDTALEGLTLIIPHIKPSLQSGPAARDVIRQEVMEANDLGLDLVFAEQGKRFSF
jgi:3',5'-cyclic-nucleotide phosphodiesterase